MTDTYFEQIWIDRIDEVDLSCLQRAVKESYFGYGAEYVLEKVAEHDMQFWRGGHKGKRFILLTQIMVHPAGKELQVWSLAGEGYIKAVPFALPILLEFAARHNCRWLTGYEQKRGFSRVYSMLKPTVFRKWITEIKDVEIPALRD